MVFTWPHTHSPHGPAQQGRCGLGHIADATRQEEPHPCVTDNWTPPLSLADGRDSPSPPSSRSFDSSASPKQKSEGEAGTHNARGEIPSAPSVSHALQATTTKPWPRIWLTPPDTTRTRLNRLGFQFMSPTQLTPTPFLQILTQGFGSPFSDPSPHHHRLPSKPQPCTTIRTPERVP
jgi:hypothetical protein